MTMAYDTSKVDKTLQISDKIVKLLEDEDLTFDQAIYAVMSSLLYLHYGKTHSTMNSYLNENADPMDFLHYLRKDWKRCDGIAVNILDKIREMDNHMLLNFFEQKKIRYKGLNEHH